MPLLDTILSHMTSVMFLAPHFSPVKCAPHHFVELYTKVISHISQNEHVTVIFVLLSKFDITNWLNQQPAKPSVTALLGSIMRAIGLLGYEPNSEGLVILEVIRNHLSTLLRSNLNDHYPSVLAELLTLSSSTNVSPLCWSDFLATYGFTEDIRTAEECSISLDQIKEALYYMAGFFHNATQSVNCELETLYKLWEPYVYSLSVLLRNLFTRSITHSMLNRTGRPHDIVLREIWESLTSVFRSWIVPQSSGKIWTLLRVENVVVMVQAFTDMVRVVVELSCTKDGDDSNTNNTYCFLLNDLMSFYASEIAPRVREDQSIEIFHSQLITLPWRHYCPSLQELNFTIQVGIFLLLYICHVFFSNCCDLYKRSF